MREIPAEFWPETLSRDGCTVTREQMDAAWTQLQKLHQFTYSTLTKLLTDQHKGPSSTAVYPYSLCSEAMLNHARKAGHVRAFGWHWEHV